MGTIAYDTSRLAHCMGAYSFEEVEEKKKTYPNPPSPLPRYPDKSEYTPSHVDDIPHVLRDTFSLHILPRGNKHPIASSGGVLWPS